MMFTSHMLSGILVLKISTIFFPSIPFNSHTIIIALILSILPDLDTLWSKKLSSHHESYFHAPIFWIVIFLILLAINSQFQIFASWIPYLLLVVTLSHLLFDYIAARTAGIIIFYPFNKKEYSLFPLNKKHGEFNPLNVKKHLQFMKLFFDNSAQAFFEIGICLLGIVSLII